MSWAPTSRVHVRITLWAGLIAAFALIAGAVSAAPASALLFYNGASSDGTRVFFTTDKPLDPVADTDDARVDVYQRLGGVTTLVSGDGDGPFDAMYGGRSSDGTRVFFTTGETLDPAADTDGGESDVYQRFGGATTLISRAADPVPVIVPPPGPASQTGQRAAALKKCKKKKPGKARTNCMKKAKKLPV